jgi:hypothetical protein
MYYWFGVLDVKKLAENFDQRCRKIACRQKTELSKEIEETVSILTRKKLVNQRGKEAEQKPENDSRQNF